MTPATASAAPARKPRVHNRHDSLLAAAARVFCGKGYGQATMRDIAAASGMNAGSIYYHYPSKGDLLLAVYARGVALVSEAIEAARADGQDPWSVLESVARAHLEMMLGALPGTAPFARVFVHIQPHDFPPEHREALIGMRHAYENLFRELVAALPLPRGADRSLLRLQLLGALNHVPIWWRPGGRKSLAAIARATVRHLRAPLEVGR
jgi:AcrR family transcriptional regulator